MFKVSKNVYLNDDDILDLREGTPDKLSVVIEPNGEGEYSLEKNMFDAYPEKGIPYSDSGSWIGMYNNGYTTTNDNSFGM